MSFEIENGKLKKYSGNDSEIVIPNNVVSIEAFAFSQCKTITAVTIPDSVKSIGRMAFFECTGLIHLVIGNGLTDIGPLAFVGCYNLAFINVFGGNKTYHSYQNCIIETQSKTLIVGSKNGKIPNDGSVTSIDRDAFRGQRALTSIKIPNCVEKIGSYAFRSCANLTSISIPSSVTYMEDSIFIDCPNLVRMEVSKANPIYHSYENSIIEKATKTLIAGCKTSRIPQDGSVVTIGKNAFEYCSGLTNMVIPKGVEHIGVFAFDGCTNLQSIIVSSTVVTIDAHAFSNCKNLANVKIRYGLKSIADHAFDGCTNLDSIEIPESVTEIGEKAFDKNTKVIRITGRDVDEDAEECSITPDTAKKGFLGKIASLFGNSK